MFKKKIKNNESITFEWFDIEAIQQITKSVQQLEHTIRSSLNLYKIPNDLTIEI